MSVRDLFDVDRSDADDDGWLAEEREVLTAAWRDLKPMLEVAQRERDNAVSGLQRMRTRRATRVARAIDDPLRLAVRSLRDVGERLRPTTPAVNEAAPLGLPTPDDFRRSFVARLDDPGRLHVAVLDSEAAVVPAPAPDGLAGAMAAAGWTVVSAPAAADVLIVADPHIDVHGIARGPVLVALIRDRESWRARTDLEAYDLVIVPDAASGAGLDGNVVALGPALEPALGPGSATALADGLGRLLRDWVSGIRIGISIGIPSWDVAETWGDLHFARAMQRAFARRGHATRIHLLREWADRVAARDDIAIHVFGLSGRARLPGQRTILWVISHPERVTPAMLSGADRTYVASDPATERLQRAIFSTQYCKIRLSRRGLTAA